MKRIHIELNSNQKETLRLEFPKENAFDVQIDLLGEGSEITLLGAFNIFEKQEVNFDLVINHLAPRTTSRTILKAVVDKGAFGRFNGLVTIQKGAVGTVTSLKEDALLLTKDARAEMIPSLEIDENDVVATHSSAVSPIDDNQLFYFQSRGISTPNAKKILAKAFFSLALAS